jgi:hypothetical protein
LCAPAIVRVGSLMPVRGIIFPTGRHYFGFVERLIASNSQAALWRLSYELRQLAHLGRSARLGPSLKDHVERALRRPPNLRKPACANVFSQLGLACLSAQAFANFLVQ